MSDDERALLPTNHLADRLTRLAVSASDLTSATRHKLSTKGAPTSMSTAVTVPDNNDNPITDIPITDNHTSDTVPRGLQRSESASTVIATDDAPAATLPCSTAQSPESATAPPLDPPSSLSRSKSLPSKTLASYRDKLATKPGLTGSNLPMPPRGFRKHGAAVGSEPAKGGTALGSGEAKVTAALGNGEAKGAAAVTAVVTASSALPAAVAHVAQDEAAQNKAAQDEVARGQDQPRLSSQIEPPANGVSLQVGRLLAVLCLLAYMLSGSQLHRPPFPLPGVLRKSRPGCRQWDCRTMQRSLPLSTWTAATSSISTTTTCAASASRCYTTGS